MYNVKLLNNIKSSALEKLDAAKYNVCAEIENPNAILVRSAKLHDMEFNPELLCIARAGAGVNNIPLDRCAEAGIVVFNTPGANAEGVKELALCSLFLSSRAVIDGVNWVKTIAGEGDEVPALVEKNKSKYGGPEILGKTLGVVGLGAIGAKIANAACKLGMKVIGYDPFLSVNGALSLSRKIKLVDNLDEIYKNSDYITLHVPLLDATRQFINGETITKMKPGVRIINLSRAELVCDDSIIAALDSGQVSCYVTDFPNAKTAGAKGVIAIPHLGASTPESEENCVSMACDEIIDYIENGNIVNSVNVASASLPRSESPRICVIHKNSPDAASKITAAVSALGVNTLNMLTANAKGNIVSYSILDVDTLNDGIKETVGGLDEVIKVRVLP